LHVDFFKIFRIKIIRKIALFAVILIALAPVAAYLSLQLPSLQSRAAKQAAKTLSNKLNTEVFVEKVYYIFFKRINECN